MRLPRSVLEQIRGPAVVVLLGACAAPAAPITAAPVAPPPAVAVAPAPIDPIAYDLRREEMRFARDDERAVVDEARRERRIAALRPRPSRARLTGDVGVGSIGRPGPGWYGVGCGRG